MFSEHLQPSSSSEVHGASEHGLSSSELELIDQHSWLKIGLGSAACGSQAEPLATLMTLYKTTVLLHCHLHSEIPKMCLWVLYHDHHRSWELGMRGSKYPMCSNLALMHDNLAGSVTDIQNQTWFLQSWSAKHCKHIASKKMTKFFLHTFSLKVQLAKPAEHPPQIFLHWWCNFLWYLARWTTTCCFCNIAKKL